MKSSAVKKLLPRLRNHMGLLILAMLSAVGAAKKSLIVLPEADAMVVKSCANIPGAKTTLANTINVYDILNSGKLVVDKSAVEKIQEVYTR